MNDYMNNHLNYKNVLIIYLAVCEVIIKHRSVHQDRSESGRAVVSVLLL